MSKDSQSRSWILTLPASEYDKNFILDSTESYTFIAGQLERGMPSEQNPEGYLHYQLMLENSSPIRFSTLRNLFPKGHFEPRHGSRRDAFDYVTKEDTREEEPFTRGEIDLDDNQGRRSDLDEFHARIVAGERVNDLILDCPSALRFTRYLRDLEATVQHIKWSSIERDVEVNYLCGEPGTGKTRFIHDKYKLGEFYYVTNYSHPFDNYQCEPVLVLDEFDSQIEFSTMLTLLDRYPMRLPARYYDKPAAYSTVWVISNRQFDDLYPFYRFTNQWAAFRRRFHNIYRMVEGLPLRVDVSKN